MLNDPIVEHVHQIRETMAQRFNAHLITSNVSGPMILDSPSSARFDFRQIETVNQTFQKTSLIALAHLTNCLGKSRLLRK